MKKLLIIATLLPLGLIAQGTNDLAPRQNVPATFATLGTEVDFVQQGCSDCTIGSPTTGGGTGALVVGINGVWVGMAPGVATNPPTLTNLTTLTANGSRPSHCQQCPTSPIVTLNPLLFDSNNSGGTCSTGGTAIQIWSVTDAGSGFIDLNAAHPALNALGNKNMGNAKWDPTGQWVVLQFQDSTSSAACNSSGANPGAGFDQNIAVCRNDFSQCTKMTAYAINAGLGVLHPHLSQNFMWWMAVTGSGGTTGGVNFHGNFSYAPFSIVTAVAATPTGTATINTNTLTVSSGTSVAIGQRVVGAGIPPYTDVIGGSGTSWTLSNNVYAALSTTPVTFFTDTPTIGTVVACGPGACGLPAATPNWFEGAGYDPNDLDSAYFTTGQLHANTTVYKFDLNTGTMRNAVSNTNGTTYSEFWECEPTGSYALFMTTEFVPGQVVGAGVPLTDLAVANCATGLKRYPLTFYNDPRSAEYNAAGITIAQSTWGPGQTYAFFGLQGLGNTRLVRGTFNPGSPYTAGAIAP